MCGGINRFCSFLRTTIFPSSTFYNFLLSIMKLHLFLGFVVLCVGLAEAGNERGGGRKEKAWASDKPSSSARASRRYSVSLFCLFSFTILFSSRLPLLRRVIRVGSTVNQTTRVNTPATGRHRLSIG